MGGAGVRSEIRLAKFISIETGGTPPQNFNFHAYTNFVKRSNRNATTRGSGPEQTCSDQQSSFGPRANMFRRPQLAGNTFSLKETCFSLKETRFSLKETCFSLKETRFSLKETCFSLQQIDPRPPSPAPAGAGGLGSVRRVQFWTSKSQVFAVFQNFNFSSYASMLHMVFAGSLDRKKLGRSLYFFGAHEDWIRFSLKKEWKKVETNEKDTHLHLAFARCRGHPRSCIFSCFFYVVHKNRA